MIDDDREDERIGRGDARRLGRAEHAGPDAADDDDRREQGEERRLGGLPDLRQLNLWTG